MDYPAGPEEILAIKESSRALCNLTQLSFSDILSMATLEG
jgi:hypothetical protein